MSAQDDERVDAASAPTQAAGDADRNIRYWAGPTLERAPVVIRDGRVNFHCLADQCPTPCCGPFAGLGQGFTPCFVTSFADLYLLDEDVDRLLQAGRMDLVEHTDAGYKLHLRTDTSCAAFQNGLCSIHTIRPAICHAFPFDFDVFAGLVMISKCPGVNAGWSEPEQLADSLARVYQHWIQAASNRVRRETAAASDQIPLEEDLPGFKDN